MAEQKGKGGRVTVIASPGGAVLDNARGNQDSAAKEKSTAVARTRFNFSLSKASIRFRISSIDSNILLAALVTRLRMRSLYRKRATPAKASAVPTGSAASSIARTCRASLRFPVISKIVLMSSLVKVDMAQSIAPAIVQANAPRRSVRTSRLLLALSVRSVRNSVRSVSKKRRSVTTRNQ